MTWSFAMTKPTSQPGDDPAGLTERMLAPSAHAGWHNKEAACRRHGDRDISPQLEAWRDGNLIAAVICPEVDKTLAFTAATVAAPGFDADTLTLTFDAHVAASPINPATGQSWEPGQMQRACDEEGACDLGIITDCLLTLLVHRDGAMASWMRKYRVDKTAGRVHWIDPVEKRTNRSDMDLVGQFPDELRESLALPSLWPLIAPEATALGLSAAETRARLDTATAEAIAVAVPGATVLLVAGASHAGSPRSPGED
jgi:hypothetical protein